MKGGHACPYDSVTPVIFISMKTATSPTPQRRYVQSLFNDAFSAALGGCGEDGPDITFARTGVGSQLDQ
jgi:hypothetical protein